MSPIDIVILLAVGVAFAAVVARLRKKGTCGDCSSAGSCGGACASCATATRSTCPACEGADAVAARLSKDVSAKDR